MATLDGSTDVVELAPGYRIRAPGFQGTAEVRGARDWGARGLGDEVATTALDDALRTTEMREVQSIVMDGMLVPVPSDEQVRTASGDPGIAVEVPDLGEAVGQVVMAVDEDGTVTWSYPLDQISDAGTSATRDMTRTKTFVIRSTRPEMSTGDGQRER